MTTDLIFDFFGTLVGYTPGHLTGAPYAATHQAVRRYGIDISYDDFTTGFAAAFDACEARAQATLCEFHMREVVCTFVSDHHGRSIVDDAIDAIIVQYIADWNRGTVYFPNLRSLLCDLAGRYRLSIISNTHYPPLVHTNLAAMGIADLFVQVVTSVELGIRKPHPAIFRHALERLAISPEQAIYIGDSYDADYVGANGAGVRCVLIDPMDRHAALADTRVSSLFDLLSAPIVS